MSTLFALFGSAGDNSGAGAAALFLLVLYFIPTVIAIVRKLPNMGSVIVINVLLGWTIVGWIVALAMALGAGSASRVNINNVVQNNLGSFGQSAFPSAAGPVQHEQPVPLSASRWAPDPFGRNQLRYFDGREWTDSVSNGASQVHIDPAIYAPPTNGNGYLTPQWGPDPFGRYMHRYFDGSPPLLRRLALDEHGGERVARQLDGTTRAPV